MYCDVADIEKRLDPKHLAELADDDLDGAADTTVVEAAIADADGMIDTYLGERYDVPLAETTPLLRRLAVDLAVAALFARRRESASPVHDERAKLAMDILGRIASGELALAGVASTAPRAGNSTTLDTDSRFRGEGLDSY